MLKLGAIRLSRAKPLVRDHPNPDAGVQLPPLVKIALASVAVGRCAERVERHGNDLAPFLDRQVVPPPEELDQVARERRVMSVEVV